MNLPQFKEVLLGCLDANRSTEYSALITQIKQADYPLYINLLLETILQDKSERIVYASITQLYHEVKCKNIFNYKEYICTFLQKFGNIISLVLVSPSIEDNFKMIMACILSFMHVYIYNTESDVTILNYIMTSYETSPSIRQYLLHCAYEIISVDNALGGFSNSDLLKLLVSDIGDSTLYSHKIHLLFSFAMKQPNASELHEIFINLFATIPQDNLEDFIKTLSDFSEQGLGFLEPHLDHIVNKLCELAINRSFPESTRNLAITCLGSIAQGSPEMCSSAEEYYIPVIQSLIQIVAEIDDGSPWEYDPNNVSSYQFALDTLGIIFHAFQCPQMFAPIDQIVNSVITNSDSPWQALYAVFATMAEVDVITLSNIIDPANKNMALQILEQTSKFVNINSHPRVRVAIYNLISKLVSYILSPEDGYHAILIVPLLRIAAEETFPISKKYAYKALGDFLKQKSCKKSNSYFELLFPQLVNELQRQQEDYVRKYIIRCLGHLMKTSCDPDMTKLQVVFQLISNHLQYQNPEILTEAIHCFSLSITHVPHLENNMAQLCMQLFQSAVQLIDNVPEESAESLNDSIHQLILIMGKSVSIFVPSVLPKILDNSKKAITVEKREAFNNEVMLPSIYMKIPSNENAVKIYISKNDINDVYYCLNILDALLKSDVNSMNYIEQALSICQNWICNQYSIEKLQLMCWAILATIVQKFKDSRIIELVFQFYIDSIGKRGSHIYISKVLNTMMLCMDLANECNWDSPQTFAQILQTIPDLSNYIIEMKNNKVGKLAVYNKLNYPNKEIAHYDLCQINIVGFLTLCFTCRPDITGEFFNQLFAPVIEKYLANPFTLIYGIMLSTLYIIKGHNREKALEFIEFLSKCACDLDQQEELIFTCFSSMGEMFYAFPLGNERANLASDYLHFFSCYFNLNPLREDSDLMNLISDYANIAFAKFLHANIDCLDSFDAVNEFFEAPQLWNIPPDADAYFAFIALALEKGLIFLFENWPDVVMGRLLTGFITQQFSEKLRKRLAECLNGYMQNESLNAVINEALSGMKKKRQAAFWLFLSLDDLGEES